MQAAAAVDLLPYAEARVLLCPLPGAEIGPDGVLGLSDLNLAGELGRLKDKGVALLIGLVEDEELGCVVYEDIEVAAEAAGIRLLRYPLQDFSVPGPEEEDLWDRILPEAKARVREGQSVAFHCLAGCGRSGVMAGRLMIDLGMAPRTALDRIRTALPEALETESQVNYLLALTPAMGAREESSGS